MNRPAITIEQLGKCYRTAPAARRHATLRDRVSGAMRWRRKANAPGDFWALRDVTFDVDAGEILGIVGHNGSGKSTLLKILARITQPSAGRATLRGRVCPLLEVGTGFHMELTGRENVFLSGAILGMRRAEIRAKFDRIAAMAAIDHFLDTPVKRYSTGMYLRLAFSVAAHLESDVLLVDEALSVGDAVFRAVAAEKMRALASEGRAIVLVSHEFEVIRTLCNRAVWLDAGCLHSIGRPDEVIASVEGCNSQQSMSAA